MRRKLKPKNPNEKILKPVRPNIGITVAYRKKLDALIEEMNASVSFWIESAYRNNEPLITQDELPASALKATSASAGKIVSTKRHRSSPITLPSPSRNGRRLR